MRRLWLNCEVTINPEAGNSACIMSAYSGVLWHEIEQVEKEIDYKDWETKGKATLYARTATQRIEWL